MSSYAHYFHMPQGCSAALLPFPPDELIADWSSLRSALVRSRPEAFRRSEWAYLLTQLESESIRRWLQQSLGIPARTPDGPITRLLRPRGTVAVWLPNNVSLLGPLATVALTLTGNRILLKGGSGSTDLTGAFLGTVLQNLRPGPLREFLTTHVHHEVFDRTDVRNCEWATKADVRIVFGSDEAAASVHAHAPARHSISFTNRQSVVWVEEGADTPDALDTLIRVCGVYGTAGCTSPRAVVLLGGDATAARSFRDRLLSRWSIVMKEQPPMHIASANLLCWQTALAAGWDAALAPGNQAVVASGTLADAAVEGPAFLPIIPATLDEAVTALPDNIQTLGHMLLDPASPLWLGVLARTAVKRFVPVARMHHFGAIWDGSNFMRGCFEEVEVAA